MFGCMIANQALLSEPEKARYKGCYCGLCRVLRERHGFFGRVALTYDMTFLVLVLTSMLEPEERSGMERCMAHPARRHYYWQNDITEYAADMNVALAYHNCRDDFLDDGSAVGFWEAEALQGQYEIIKSIWPRQCAAIERELEALSALERENRQEPDAAAACFGRLLGELFVTDDPLTERLRPFGDALGRMIYLQDAVIDLEDDRKSGSYKVCVEIAGGEIQIAMSAGDTDAIDSNGDVIVSGGTITITGNSSFDYDGTAQFTGGTLIVNGQTLSSIPNQMMGGMGGQMGGFGGQGGGFGGRR